MSSDCSGSVTQDDAVAFLRRLHGKRYIRKSAIDGGYELSAIDSEANVNVLVYRDIALHLAGFPQQKDEYRIGINDNERRIPVMRR